MNGKRVAAVVTLVLVSAIGGYQLKVHAQQESHYPTVCRVVLPAEWGKFKGVAAGSGMVFEDKDGTLRVIAEMPCSIEGAVLGPPVVTAEIRRR